MRETITGAELYGLASTYLRGFCMGAADAVPGVSGGTIALITGIYGRMIAAITAVKPGRLGRVVRGLRATNRNDARTALRELDVGFLLVLGAGIATAVITVLRVISVLLETNPVETYGFFFGLIAASAAVLSRDVSLATRGRKAAAVGGFATAFVVSGYAAATADSTLPLVFLSGTVAISAMILPGVSGSLLLLMLGQYEYMSTTLREFTDALGAVLGGGDAVAVVDSGVPVAVFLTGAVVGLFTVAHSVRLALERYREATVAFLVALIFGSLRAPVEQTSIELAAAGGAWTAETLGLFLAFGVAGAAAVAAIDHLAGGIDAGSV